MKPADSSIYCCVIYAVCSHSPEVEQHPEPSCAISHQCEVLGSLPQLVIDLWEPPNYLVWPQISLFSWVKLGHFNASCRQVDGVLPMRPVSEIGENLISMCFSMSVRFFFFFPKIATLFKLKNLKMPCALLSSSAKWVKPCGAGRPGW